MSRYSELIFLYLDGEATPEEQQELFEALSQDPALQREFHQALDLYRAIEAERLTTAAPSEVKQAVYAAIGLTPATPLARRLLPYWGIVGGIALMSIGLFLWRGHQTPSPMAATVTAAAPIEVRVPASVTARPRPELLPAVQPIAASASVDQQDQTSSAASAPASTLAFDDGSHFVLDRSTTPIGPASPLLRQARWRVGMVNLPKQWSNTTHEAALAAYVSYRGSLLATSGPAASPQNFSIAALYRFDEHHRLGIEFRRAPYTLNLAQPSGTLSTVMLSSLAVAYMFSEPDVRVLGGIPFVQPGVGVTELGPLATLSAGLSFPVSTDFRFNVGLDGSALVYSSQVSSSLSVALGISLGLPIR